jgi:predicted DNA-binding protein YlxM (UPF0122 family)
MHTKSPLQKRKIEALRLRKKGWTLDMIGRKYGVSRQAVHQWIGRTKRFMVAFDERVN